MRTKKRNYYFLFVSIFALVLSMTGNLSQPAYAQETPPGPDSEEFLHPEVEVVSPYLSIVHQTMADGKAVSGYVINGPPAPPPGFERESNASIQLSPSAVSLTNFPSYKWVFGCSAVSGAMIAAYYDRGAYPNMYTGRTNGGLMPLTDTSWPTWPVDASDPDDIHRYPNNPLIASHKDIDGRGTKGSIDDYWVSYLSIENDPYIGSWTQHTWETAIGDYMKTSQSASPYLNRDGSTVFYTYTSNPKRFTCSDMEFYIKDDEDGTYGRKLFYEARGYTVTDCYNQNTDNNAGGFSLADFKAEIDAGHPVLLNLAGHSIVGFGYDGSTVFLRDTWDNDPAQIYKSMQWGGSYDGMDLLSVSIVHLQASTLVNKVFLPLVMKP